MNPRGECLSPERMRKSRFGECSADRFDDGAISALGDAILLRAIARRVSCLNAMLAPEIVPTLSDKLAALVVLQRLDLASGAVLGPSLELDERVKRVRLTREWIRRMEARCVIVKRDEVPVA